MLSNLQHLKRHRDDIKLECHWSTSVSSADCNTPELNSRKRFRKVDKKLNKLTSKLFSDSESEIEAEHSEVEASENSE